MKNNCSTLIVKPNCPAHYRVYYRYIQLVFLPKLLVRAIGQVAWLYSVKVIVCDT